jgi:hypothetical protein
MLKVTTHWRITAIPKQSRSKSPQKQLDPDEREKIYAHVKDKRVAVRKTGGKIDRRV